MDIISNGVNIYVPACTPFTDPNCVISGNMRIHNSGVKVTVGSRVTAKYVEWPDELLQHMRLWKMDPNEYLSFRFVY